MVSPPALLNLTVTEHLAAKSVAPTLDIVALVESVHCVATPITVHAYARGLSRVGQVDALFETVLGLEPSDEIAFERRHLARIEEAGLHLEHVDDGQVLLDLNFSLLHDLEQVQGLCLLPHLDNGRRYDRVRLGGEEFGQLLGPRLCHAVFEAPEVEFDFEALLQEFVFYVRHAAPISQVTNDYLKHICVAIDENSPGLGNLESVSARKHGLEGTAFDPSQNGPRDFQSRLPANIECQEVAAGEVLFCHKLLLDCKFLLFSLQQLEALGHEFELSFHLSVFFLRLLYAIVVDCKLFGEFLAQGGLIDRIFGGDRLVCVPTV